MQSLVWLHFYRDTIARVTQEYITGLEVSDDEEPLDLYLKLAWRGLNNDGVTAWNSLSEDQREDINNTINTYLTEHNSQTCNED